MLPERGAPPGDGNRADRSTVLPAVSDESGVSYGARLVATLIVCGMAVGSVALWIGNPIFWFWLTGRLQGTQATMGPTRS